MQLNYNPYQITYHSVAGNATRARYALRYTDFNVTLALSSLPQ